MILKILLSLLIFAAWFTAMFYIAIVVGVLFGDVDDRDY